MLWFTGCAITSDHMTVVHKPLSPERNKASIVFIRASNLGAAVQATIYDGKEYIGTVSGMTKVAYHTEPGEHMFMVIAESADFMQATLEAGKTYYAQIVPRPGVWKARFSFRPINDVAGETRLQQWIAKTTMVEPNEKGYEWAKANAESITEKHDAYLPKWQEKDRKQILEASSGR